MADDQYLPVTAMIPTKIVMALDKIANLHSLRRAKLVAKILATTVQSLGERVETDSTVVGEKNDLGVSKSIRISMRDLL